MKVFLTDLAVSPWNFLWPTTSSAVTNFHRRDYGVWTNFIDLYGKGCGKSWFLAILRGTERQLPALPRLNVTRYGFQENIAPAQLGLAGQSWRTPSRKNDQRIRQSWRSTCWTHGEKISLLICVISCTNLWVELGIWWFRTTEEEFPTEFWCWGTGWFLLSDIEICFQQFYLRPNLLTFIIVQP